MGNEISFVDYVRIGWVAVATYENVFSVVTDADTGESYTCFDASRSLDAMFASSCGEVLQKVKGSVFGETYYVGVCYVSIRDLERVLLGDLDERRHTRIYVYDCTLMDLGTE